jgi:hypothetical protein
MEYWFTLLHFVMDGPVLSKNVGQVIICKKHEIIWPTISQIRRSGYAPPIFQIKNEVKLEEEELKTSEISKFTKTSQLQNLKGPKRFICSRCNASFQDKHDLKTHNLSVHDGKKVFRGPIFKWTEKEFLKNLLLHC